MLRLNNVEVKYVGVILVLRGVSIEIGDGKLVALLGANGAGKTTTLKAISGLLGTEEGEVTDGSIEFDGHRIDNSVPEEIVKLGIVQVLEGRRVLGHLSVEDNLRAGAYIRRDGDIKKELDTIYEYFPPLKELRDQTSGYLSGGEQQMLVIGRGLMAKPKLMLLDEASLGLAPLMVKEIFEIVRKINLEENTSVFLVEQNAMVALSIAEYGYVIENGRIVLDGPAAKLRDNQDVQEFYMGLSEIGTRKSFREVKHYRRRKRWLG
jgi:branched-chain amino acid transport system ATP-binding protein